MLEAGRNPRMAEVGRMERLVVDVREAAQSLGISPSALYELARRGRVKVVRLRRRVLVPLDEVRRLATATEKAPEPGR